MITADFKRRALIPAVDMINRYTSMRIELLGSFKKGQAIDGFIFSVSIDEKELKS